MKFDLLVEEILEEKLNWKKTAGAVAAIGLGAGAFLGGSKNKNLENNTFTDKMINQRMEAVMSPYTNEDERDAFILAIDSLTPEQRKHINSYAKIFGPAKGQMEFNRIVNEYRYAVSKTNPASEQIRQTRKTVISPDFNESVENH
jgi:hypothetical protein